MSGETDQIAGRIKQAAGDLTNDEQLELEGETQESAGKLKDAVDDVKDKANDAIDKVMSKLN